MRTATVMGLLIGVTPLGLSHAQELPPELREDPYVQEFLKIIDEWNNRTIELPPAEAIRDAFQQRLDRSVKRGENKYATPRWAELKMRQFNALPKTAEPILAFDHDAVVTLTLAFSINLPQVRERFPPDRLQEELTIPTYIVFVQSQDQALKSGSTSITAKAVLAAIFKWWTTTFPFCAPSAA